MNKNHSIKCDVKDCKHNGENCSCQLDGIKITCSCGENCTCCDSFSQK